MDEPGNREASPVPVPGLPVPVLGLPVPVLPVPSGVASGPYENSGPDLVTLPETNRFFGFQTHDTDVFRQPRSGSEVRQKTMSKLAKFD